jgi:hypothetical protein
LTDQINQNNAARGGAGNGSQPQLHQIGTLTVDQSGTGRMQQVVEGIQVQAVVGQAIVLYSQNAPNANQQTTLPSNLDPSTDPSSPNSENGASKASLPAASGNNQVAPNPGAPVAGGIIRLMTDRRPTPTSSGAAIDDAFGPSTNAPQPEANRAPAERAPVR